jgi:Glycosyl hydrolase family 45
MMLAMLTAIAALQSVFAGDRCGYSRDHALQWCGTACVDDGGCSYGMRCWKALDRPDCGDGSESAAPSSKLRGRSTRYWDCAKPSCAWEFGVRSCAKDGKTTVPSSEQSGADGGIAFACDSQQPFVGEDGKGYGFAAVSEDLCCRCFELRFTDTAVAGKTMVVQIVNTGPHESGHFDLAMPGGGIGGVDGCTPQFGKGHDWGQLYGGHYTRDACYGIPEQLRPGCMFRYDWFAGAVNPSFEYAEVSCPTELSDKSGCPKLAEA